MSRWRARVAGVRRRGAAPAAAGAVRRGRGGPGRRARCARWPGRPAPAVAAGRPRRRRPARAWRRGRRARRRRRRRPAGRSSAGRGRPRRAPVGRGRGAARRGSRRGARCPDQRRRPEPLRPPGEVVDLVRRQLHELGRHQRQEPVAKVADEGLGDRPRLVAGVDGVGHRRRGRGPESWSIIASTSSSNGHRLADRRRRRWRSARAPTACRAPSRRPGRGRRRWPRRRRRARRRRRPSGRARRASSGGRRWKRRCWVRLRIVSLTFCGSVVASTNTTCGGGSSSVFSSAASAPGDSMWTSSRMYTLCRPGVPSDARSMRSRIAVDAVVAGRVELVDVVARALLDGEAGRALAARLAVDRAARS